MSRLAKTHLAARLAGGSCRSTSTLLLRYVHGTHVAAHARMGRAPLWLDATLGVAGSPARERRWRMGAWRARDATSCHRQVTEHFSISLWASGVLGVTCAAARPARLRRRIVQQTCSDFERFSSLVAWPGRRKMPGRGCQPAILFFFEKTKASALFLPFSFTSHCSSAAGPRTSEAE